MSDWLVLNFDRQNTGVVRYFLYLQPSDKDCERPRTDSLVSFPRAFNIRHMNFGLSIVMSWRYDGYFKLVLCIDSFLHLT